MFKKPQVYYYDTETCTYRPEQNTPKVLLRKSILYLVFGFMAVMGAKFCFDSYFVQIKSAELFEENEGLMGRLNDINGRIDAFDQNLSSLYQKENELYLPMLGERTIPSGIWKAGTGGEAIFDKSLNNAAHKTDLRMGNLRYRLDLLGASLDHIHTRAANIEDGLANMPSILPVSGTLMSGFGNRNHPVSGHVKFHEGLDFACEVGTPIYASGNGVIEVAESGEHGYGICLNIDHQNGYATKYAHLSKMVARPGQSVTRGQLIAYSGNTGLSTGPHLHYEVSHKGVKIDPIDFIYMDLPPQEYQRLKLDKASVTKEQLKEKLVVPAMD